MCVVCANYILFGLKNLVGSIIIVGEYSRKVDRVSMRSFEHNI